jgi:hypothetical protein
MSEATHTFEFGEDFELMPGVVCRLMSDGAQYSWGEVEIQRDDLEFRETPHGPQIFPKYESDSWPWIDPSPTTRATIRRGA